MNKNNKILPALLCLAFSSLTAISYADTNIQVTELYEVGQGNVALTTSLPSPPARERLGVRSKITNQYIYSPYGMQNNLDHPILNPPLLQAEDGSGEQAYQNLFNQTRKPLNITHNQFGYTGQTADPSTNLMMLGGFRNYAPGIGRFIQPDTYNSFTKTEINNAFMYGNGNPVLNSDPSGHWTEADTVSNMFDLFSAGLGAGVYEAGIRGLEKWAAGSWLKQAFRYFIPTLGATVVGGLMGAAKVATINSMHLLRAPIPWTASGGWKDIIHGAILGASVPIARMLWGAGQLVNGARIAAKTARSLDDAKIGLSELADKLKELPFDDRELTDSEISSTKSNPFLTPERRESGFSDETKGTPKADLARIYGQGSWPGDPEKGDVIVTFGSELSSRLSAFRGVSEDFEPLSGEATPRVPEGSEPPFYRRWYDRIFSSTRASPLEQELLGDGGSPQQPPGYGAT